MSLKFGLWAFIKVPKIGFVGIKNYLKFKNFGQSRRFPIFGSVNICIKAREAGSAGVHKYAVNLGLSAFKSVPEIWVW